MICRWYLELVNKFPDIDCDAFVCMPNHVHFVVVCPYGWAPFPGKLWQRNYWEHIVRNEPELNRIREYIHNNPAQWEPDKLFVRADLRGILLHPKLQTSDQLN